MLDLQPTLRAAYVTLLSGNISVNIYDKVPSGAAYPYVYFSMFTDQYDANSNKEKNCHDATMTLVAVAKFQGNFGGQAVVDNIINQIVGIICPNKRTTPFSLGLNFNHNIISAEESRTFTMESPDGVLMYRSQKFRHNINQI
jgi:hypothetical protein